MSVIDTLITDRSAADVARWKYLHDKGFAAMTSAERSEWLGTLKGSYDYTDLNRVGEAVAYIAARLSTYGYPVSVAPKTDWTVTSIPTPAQLTTYLANVATLKAVVSALTSLPSTVSGMSQIDANNIEKLLAEVEQLINNMVAAFRYCGMASSGQGGLI